MISREVFSEYLLLNMWLLCIVFVLIVLYCLYKEVIQVYVWKSCVYGQRISGGYRAGNDMKQNCTKNSIKCVNLMEHCQYFYIANFYKFHMSNENLKQNKHKCEKRYNTLPCMALHYTTSKLLTKIKLPLLKILYDGS